MASPPPSRRDVLRALGLGALALPVAGCGTSLWPGGSRTTPPVPPSAPPPVAPLPVEAAEVMTVPEPSAIEPIAIARPMVLPPRLQAGGTVALIAPAGVLRNRGQVDEATEALEGLGLRTTVGRHVLDRFGFLAGSDAARARDVMDAFRDPDVDAIVAMRGGWGCARILPFLDFDEIAAHPKPLVGYSDITALLLAIYARTGMVTFHGPVGVSTWSSQTAQSFVQTLIHGIAPVIGPETRSNRDRTRAVRPGVAEGPVVGGNLTVISALAGTGFLPDADGHLVFFEEVGEDAYRVDRVLAQLQLAGFLREPAGIAFGQCSSCSSGGSAWTAEETIRRHLEGYACPSVLGAPIGHVSPVYTLPIGLRARLDADAGTLEYLGPAVA